MIIRAADLVGTESSPYGRVTIPEGSSLVRKLFCCVFPVCFVCFFFQKKKLEDTAVFGLYCWSERLSAAAATQLKFQSNVLGLSRSITECKC